MIFPPFVYVALSAILVAAGILQTWNHAFGWATASFGMAALAAFSAYASWKARNRA